MTEKIKIIRTRKKERQLRCYFCDKTFTVERNWKVFYCPYCTKVNALPDILKDKSIKYLVPEKNTVYMDTVYNIPKHILSQCPLCKYENRVYEESINVNCSRCRIEYDLSKQTTYSSSDEEEIVVVKSPKKKKKIVMIEENDNTGYSYQYPQLPNIYKYESYINHALRNPFYNLLYSPKVLYDPEIDLLRRCEIENLYEKEKWRNLYKQKKELESLKKEVVYSKLEAFKNLSKSSNYQRNYVKSPFLAKI